MNLQQLIAEYREKVDLSLRMFEEDYDRRDLIEAWRSGVIPQSGTLSSGATFEFHGVGCCVEFHNHWVDFDFATPVTPGFDAWRLWQYAKQFPEKFDCVPPLKDFEARMTDLAEKRVIFKTSDGARSAVNESLYLWDPV